MNELLKAATAAHTAMLAMSTHGDWGSEAGNFEEIAKKLGDAIKQPEPNIGYTVAHELATKTRFSYNEICALLRLLNPPAPTIPWREMIKDTKEVFDYDGKETPQPVRDVIEYVKSWSQVYADKAAQFGQRASGITLPRDVAKSLESEWKQHPPKLQPAPSAQPEQQANPDECAANGNGHLMRRGGPGGEVQCEWCGEAPVAQPEQQADDLLNLFDLYAANLLRGANAQAAITRDAFRSRLEAAHPPARPQWPIAADLAARIAQRQSVSYEVVQLVARAVLTGIGEAAQPEQLTLLPCRSPYCECSPGKCTRPMRYDARNEPTPETPK